MWKDRLKEVIYILENSNINEIEVRFWFRKIKVTKAPPIINADPDTLSKKTTIKEKPFVNVGSKINEGDVICIIEAMKIMNEIQSEKNGTIKEILIKDGNPIEFDQPLFVIDCSE